MQKFAVRCGCGRSLTQYGRDGRNALSVRMRHARSGHSDARDHTSLRVRRLPHAGHHEGPAAFLQRPMQADGLPCPLGNAGRLIENTRTHGPHTPRHSADPHRRPRHRLPAPLLPPLRPRTHPARFTAPGLRGSMRSRAPTTGPARPRGRPGHDPRNIGETVTCWPLTHIPRGPTDIFTARHAACTPRTGPTPATRTGERRGQSGAHRTAEPGSPAQGKPLLHAPHRPWKRYAPGVTTRCGTPERRATYN